MAENVVKAKKARSRLADDLFASLKEARDYAAGKPTNVIVHTVIPSDSDARRARHTLGLSAKGSSAPADPLARRAR